jgi:hypothetical protein
MAFNIDTSPEHLAKLIRDGIGGALEEHIKRELLAHVNPIISKLARDIAASTKLNVESYYAPVGDRNAFGPEVRVLLSFNNKDVVYEAPRTAGGRQEGFGALGQDRVGG